MNIAGIFIFFYFSLVAAKLRQKDLLQLREETRDMFFHGYDSYLRYGYPHDEVMPISCVGRKYDERVRGTLDDVLGGYMLTLVDSLDALLVMREFKRFNEALQLLGNLTFDRDVEVSVFESNIRVLGGLLSAHQLALVLNANLNNSYDGRFLLDHAEDLARRLLPVSKYIFFFECLLIFHLYFNTNSFSRFPEFTT